MFNLFSSIASEIVQAAASMFFAMAVNYVSSLFS
jgi:hypothetical protein